MRGLLPTATFFWLFMAIIFRSSLCLVFASVATLLWVCCEAYEWAEDRKYQAMRKEVEERGNHHRP